MKMREELLPIYLDNHATTPLDKRVLDAMMPYLTTEFGNPSSSHRYGLRAKNAIEKARSQVASLIDAEPSEIIFTSGATESNNMVLKCLAKMAHLKGKNHIVTVATEHKAILDTCAYLEKEGYDVAYLKPNSKGLLTLEQIKNAIGANTFLVSIMLVNNEIGVTQPIAEVGNYLKTHHKEVFFHCDAAQGVGRVPCSVKVLGVDFLSLSGHKIYGPKGIGALFVGKNLACSWEPLICGGGQEKGYRSGTLNVAGIVGLGEASALLQQEEEEECHRIGELRQTLLDCLSLGIPGIKVNGCLQNRVAGNLSIVFPAVEGSALMETLADKIAVSSTSACSSGKSGTSHVLEAIGLDKKSMQATLRLGIGRFNTEAEIEKAAIYLIEAWRRHQGSGLMNFVRSDKISPTYGIFKHHPEKNSSGRNS